MPFYLFAFGIRIVYPRTILLYNLYTVKSFLYISYTLVLMKERLREIRLASGKTAKEVATALGMTLGAYAHYEQGVREPSIDTLRKLCDYFDVSADFLIGRSDSY